MNKKTFIKQMGWDEPKYGWTKEKRLLNKLLQSEREKQHTKDIEMFREMINKLDTGEGELFNKTIRQMLLSELNTLEVKEEKE